MPRRSSDGGHAPDPMPENHSLNLSVEGWRALSHSYAIVNQWHLLELAKRPGVELRVRDLPFFQKHWRAQTGLFPEKDEQTLRALTPVTPAFAPDVTWRTAFPYDFSPAATGKTVVFGTAEGRHLKLPENTNVRAILDNPAVTVTTPSQWSAEGFRRMGFDEARIAVIPHGVAPEMFARRQGVRETLRQRLGLTGFVFMNVAGAMTLNKGIDLLLRAFAVVAERHKDARLFLKGSNDLYASQSTISRFLGTLPSATAALILERLVYNGQSLPIADMSALYQAADAYVSPYRAEGFNIPVLEAAASGLPVICTRGGPTDDFIAPDFARPIDSRLTSESPWFPGSDIVEPDLDHLIALMDGVMTDAAFRAQAATAGPAYTAQNFTWSHAVDKLLAHARTP